MSWLFKKTYVSYTSDVSSRDTRSTKFNQLYTPKPNCELFHKSFMYSGAAIWNSLPLHVKNAISVNTFKSLYLKLKRLNGHWIISIATANLILYFYWFSQCILDVFSMTCMSWYWCPCKCNVSYELQQL